MRTFPARIHVGTAHAASLSLRAGFALLGLLLGVVLLLYLTGGNARNSASALLSQAITPTAGPTLLTDPLPDPREEGVLWFAPTGHTLRGAFKEYWLEYGGLLQFGYPLTEEFFEPSGVGNSPLRVQYFERARFEHHPENAGSQYEVLLGALGREFRKQDPAAARLTDALYFPETGHNLSGVFRRYWEEHGGLFVHGYPLTEPQMERSTDGREYLVQWFERSRFELHPENGPPYDVLLGLLGRQLSEKKGYPWGWYPLYGHAPDYSWVSGRYELDTRRCANCGCENIHYVFSADRFADRTKKGVRIKPYGSAMFDVPLLELDSSRLLVVFGRLDKPIDLEPEGTETCEKPAFLVERVQTNPSRGALGGPSTASPTALATPVPTTYDTPTPVVRRTATRGPSASPSAPLPPTPSAAPSVPVPVPSVPAPVPSVPVPVPSVPIPPPVPSSQPGT